MRNLIPHFIAEKYNAGKTSGNFMATTMFLDISGFTQMTERLMREGKEGAEILSVIINNIFEPVIETVYNSGGFISTFAGDAFTAVFQGTDQAERTVNCAVEINNIFQEICSQKTKFGDYELYVKIGLSYGLAEWGIIGNDRHKSYYFKGEAIDGCAHSEHNCLQMDIVLDSKILALLTSDQAEVISIDENYYKLILFHGTPSKDNVNPDILAGSSISKEILQKFVPDQVLELTQNDEFRDIVSVFISYRELNQNDEIDQIFSEIIKLCDQFGGYLESLDFGDKGANSLIIFGVPKSYENNLDRALNFVLALKSLYDSKIRIGITSGVVFAGFNGCEIRTSYGVLGSVVNLSARLMMKAEFGEFLTTEKISKKNNFIFKLHGNYNFKGFSHALSVYSLVEKKDNVESAFYSGEMFGRKKELELLNNFAKPLSEHKFTGIITIYGEAGMGKSRLVYEFVKSRNDAEILFLQTDSVLKMSMNPFKYLLHNYFSNNFETVFDSLLKNLNDSDDNRKLQIVKEMERIKSILAAQVDVLYENSLYEQLDAKGRFENTLFAYKEFFKALSLIRPVIIQIEDIHWLDDDSQKLVQTLCRNIEDFPIMIIATGRFNDDGSKPLLNVDKETVRQEIVLDKLEQTAAFSFIEFQLEGKAEPDLLNFISEKGVYNPFYIEQIIHYLKENNLLIREHEIFTLAKKEIAIPESINAIIIARIDRLSGELKNIVQMASVFGREVELKVFLLMFELYQSDLNKNQIGLLLDKIEDEQLWNKFAEIKYIFKHALLNESAYEMQLKSRLRDLHKLAAQAIGLLYIDEKDKFYELARHFEKAEMIEETVKYYEKAGDWLKENFQNEKAIECFEKILRIFSKLPVTDNELKANIQLKLSELYELIGKWADSQKIREEALAIAEESGLPLLVGRASDALGRIMSGKGLYDQAMIHFTKASEIFKELNEKSFYGKVVNNIGNVFKDKGNYPEAVKCYQDYMSICKETSDKKGISTSLGNQGMISFFTGDYDKAMAYYNEALQLCEELNDKSGISKFTGNIGSIYMNTGNFESALKCYEKQLKLAEEIGDRRFYAIASGNTGTVNYYMGRYGNTIICYEKALSISYELGDRPNVANFTGNIGGIYHQAGDYEKAAGYFQKALEISEILGDRAGVSRHTGNLGNIFLMKGELDKSLEYLNKSLTLAEELNNKREILFAMKNMGSVYTQKCEYKRAVECFERLQRIAEEMGDKGSISNALSEIGKIYNIMGNLDKAIEYFNKSLPVFEESGNKSGYSEVILNLGVTNLQKGDFGKALECCGKALALFEELENKAGVASALGNLSEVHLCLKEYDKALKSCETAIQIGKELGVKYYLCDFYNIQSRILYDLNKIDEAKIANKLAFETASEINRQDIVFSATLYKNRLEKNLEALIALLDNCLDNDEHSALVNYELWKITDDDEYSSKALKLLSDLYNRTPNIDHKNKIDELSKANYK